MLLPVVELLQEDNLVIYNGGGLIWQLRQVVVLVLEIVHMDALHLIVPQDVPQDVRGVAVHV